VVAILEEDNVGKGAMIFYLVLGGLSSVYSRSFPAHMYVCIKVMWYGYMIYVFIVVVQFHLILIVSVVQREMCSRVLIND